MNEIDKVLGQDEKIFWQGKPIFWPYFFSKTIPATIIGLILLSVIIPFLVFGSFTRNYIAYNLKQVSGMPAQISVEVRKQNDISLWWEVIISIPFLYMIFWLTIGNYIYISLLYKHLYYVITNKRLVIQKGVIGRDFEYVDFDQITKSEVNVGIWDKIFKKNTGSIFVSTSGSFIETNEGKQVATPHMLNNIEDPYSVFKFFNKVTYDIKTDIKYPNQFRPEKNLGYKTEYDPK